MATKWKALILCRGFGTTKPSTSLQQLSETTRLCSEPRLPNEIFTKCISALEPTFRTGMESRHNPALQRPLKLGCISTVLGWAESSQRRKTFTLAQLNPIAQPITIADI